MRKELFEVVIKIFKNGVLMADLQNGGTNCPSVDEADLNSRGWETVKRKRGRPRLEKRRSDNANAYFDKVKEHITGKRKYTKRSAYWKK